jgi:S1-C subfamily serine protease
MIETGSSTDEPETTHVLRVAPEEAPGPTVPLVRAALWWALPATALITGGWTAAMVLVAAGKTVDLLTTITCGASAAIAIFGGMCLFERLVGAPGSALGAGVALQLILSPFVGSGVVPGWSASAGWILTAIITIALTWRVHARRPPVIRTAEPLVTDRAAVDELVGTVEAPNPSEWVTVSGQFRLSGWPRTALQAVELPGNPPAEIDAVVSVETSWSQGTAFVIRNDGTNADLVTNEHVFAGARTARVSIAGTTRTAVLLPRPDRERFAQLLGELAPQLDRAQRRQLAEDTDLRLVRIDSSGLPVSPLEISTAEAADALALSIGYPLGGIPRFVWPANRVPLPAIGVGRLVLRGGAAELWTPWRAQAGNSGGPVLVREHGQLRVAAVTYLQHAARDSRGNVAHIPAPVLRAYVTALEATGASW